MRMKLTLAIDDRVASEASRRAEAQGKTLEQLILEYLQALAGDNSEESIAEFRQLSGGGNSHGQLFDREELHRRSK